jgi:hypothetical protein
MPTCVGGEQSERPPWAGLPFSSVRVSRDQRDDQGGATAWQQGYGRPALQPQSVASAKILVGVALITPDSRSRTE